MEVDTQRAYIFLPNFVLLADANDEQAMLHKAPQIEGKERYKQCYITTVYYIHGLR